jgi:Bacterial archaeo-eukaryotic release factor family 3
MFSRSDLDELVASEADPAVSIYLPTHTAGREILQDPTRLKNMLSSAAERLATQRRRPEIEGLLAPAAALVADRDFWRHQEHGLAVFLAPGFSRVHKLPIAIPEKMALGSPFLIKPLLPLLDDAGAFWLLTISAKHTRLYRGTRWTFAEVTGIELPQGVGEIRGMTEYEETHQGMPTGRRGAISHAQSLGETPDEVRKTELIELLRRIAAAFEPSLKRQPAPVILAAHPEIRGHFRELAGWKEIEPDGISENPDAMTPDELRQRSAALVEHKMEEARTAALDRLNALLGTGRATTNPEEIVKAARYARVERLLLAGDSELWGRFDETEDRIIAHGSAVEGDIDLFNYAMVMTLRYNGSVTLVEPNGVPRSGQIAAILRY